MNSGKIVLGALAGLAAGAVLGILLAPDKGSETRKKIAKKGKDVADDVKVKYNDVINTLASKLESAKEDGLNYFENGKS